MVKVSQYNSTRLAAFTLSDVLLTLVTIAIVALFVISPLLKNVQDAENKTAAKKAFSAANQAYKIAQIDNGGGFANYNVWDNPDSMLKFNAIKAQMKVINSCTFNTHAEGKCWSNSGVGLKGYAVPSWGYTSNTGAQFYNNSYVTADGMFWMLYSYSITNGLDLLFVDVNGDKKPNDWGKDVFIFKLNATNITPFDTDIGLKHNDGSDVNEAVEFWAPFK